MLKLLSMAAVGALVIAAAPSVNAAPAAGLHALTSTQGVVELAHWRHHRCWWSHHHHHCRWW